MTRQAECCKCCPEWQRDETDEAVERFEGLIGLLMLAMIAFLIIYGGVMVAIHDHGNPKLADQQQILGAASAVVQAGAQATGTTGR